MKDDMLDVEPKPQKPSRFLRSLPTIAWILLFAFLGFVVPRTALVFVDFGVDLPRSSAIVISLSHIVARYAPGILVFVALAWILALFSPQSTTPSRRTLLVLFLIPTALLAISILAIVIPLIGVDVRLSG